MARGETNEKILGDDDIFERFRKSGNEMTRRVAHVGIALGETTMVNWCADALNVDRRTRKNWIAAATKNQQSPHQQ